MTFSLSTPAHVTVYQWHKPKFHLLLIRIYLRSFAHTETSFASLGQINQAKTTITILNNKNKQYAKEVYTVSQRLI